MKKPFIFLLFIFAGVLVAGAQQLTYCNPVNLDYTYPFHNSHLGKSYRSGADPAVVEFRGEYYMFVTRSWGYWHSTDMHHWNFIEPEKWYLQGSNAPAAFNYKDSVLYVTGDPSGSMSILYTDNPKKGDWKASHSVLYNLQDPAFFIDDDGRSYMFWGSSNKFPIRVKELQTNNKFIPVTNETIDLFNLDPENHGWERFGENHTSDILPFIEGPWMNKVNGKYYLQYAAPGTQFNVYGDGVYIGETPLGPYRYAEHNPFCYKPGGFATGAGHGSTVMGPGGQWWHFGTIHLSINFQFERRLAFFPTFFDEDGLMYSDTYFGDYPHYSPALPQHKGAFTGWMLLSYGKPVKVSSWNPDYPGSNLNDENLKTYWVAEENNDKQWIEIDLEKLQTVRALQINYFDHEETALWGRMPGLWHRYVVEHSEDGNSWQVLVDKSRNFKDIPHDYVELNTPVKTRYIRFRNIHVPTKNLAISDIRVFGNGSDKKPAQVRNFTVKRETDKRNVHLDWEEVKGAQGYNVLWGIAPDKLYNSWMLYSGDKLEIRSLNTNQSYWFTIEAFNENGISERTEILKIE